jgi:hypothetical protein
VEGRGRPGLRGFGEDLGHQGAASVFAEDLSPVQAGGAVVAVEDVLAIGVEDAADVGGQVQIRALCERVVVHAVVVGVCAIHTAAIRIYP